MKIGIIGAGQIGGTLAQKLHGLGHEVEIANSRGPASLATFAAQAGVKAVTVEDAVKGKDLIIVSIPVKAVPNLPKDLFRDVPADVPVIDTGNYYPRERDGRIEPIEAGITEGRWTSQTLGRPTVKVFNSINYRPLGAEGKPKGAPGRLALPVSGDDPVAKAKVIALIDELGFDAVDNGGLDNSWRHQPGTPVYGHNGGIEETVRQLAEASPERTAKFSG